MNNEINIGGLRELLELLQEIYSNMHGGKIINLPVKKISSVPLDIADRQACYIARCHQVASDIRTLVSMNEKAGAS